MAMKRIDVAEIMDNWQAKLEDPDLVHDIIFAAFQTKGGNEANAAYAREYRKRKRQETNNAKSSGVRPESVTGK
jgi:hypothetical protein